MEVKSKDFNLSFHMDFNLNLSFRKDQKVIIVVAIIVIIAIIAIIAIIVTITIKAFILINDLLVYIFL